MNDEAIDANKLIEAIRKHRDQRGDDRCWLDDQELYSVLPEGVGNADLRLHCPSEMLENCKKYIASRQPDGQEYISPQREIENLTSLNKKLIHHFVEAVNWAYATKDQLDVLNYLFDNNYYTKEEMSEVLNNSDY